MKELDTVEVIVEKEGYAKEGVHQGMQGWICLDDYTDKRYLVNFPQCGEKRDIATISMKESDLKLINGMDAKINERIKEEFEE